MKIKGRGSTTYKNDNRGIEIVVSAQACRLIGPVYAPAFVDRLIEFMSTTRGNWAYVSKNDGSITITINLQSHLPQQPMGVKA